MPLAQILGSVGLAPYLGIVADAKTVDNLAVASAISAIFSANSQH